MSEIVASWDPACSFCAIAAGLDRTVEVICEGVGWIAFAPDSPATPGHTLVIPRRHIKNLWDADFSTGTALMAAVVRVGRSVIDALQPEGMNLISSAGEVAEQSVPHLHLHILPRWAGDRIGPLWPENRKVDKSTVASWAAQVRDRCAEGRDASDG